jgi:hypothetical protein
MTTQHERLLRRVRLELPRDHEFPNGSNERGYDFIAPSDRKGHIELAAWKDLKDGCRVRRFWAHEAWAMWCTSAAMCGLSTTTSMAMRATMSPASGSTVTRSCLANTYRSKSQTTPFATFRVASVRVLD